MNVEQLLNAGEEGHKWNIFRRSSASKKKIIAALVAWNEKLSKELAEYNQSERELYHENGDLRCLQAQLEEKLNAALAQVKESKGREIQLEQKLCKARERTRSLDEEVNTTKLRALEIEMSKQQLQNEIQRLKQDIKGKTEEINHVTDALEKCKHDCANSETKYLTLENEKFRTEDKVRAAEDKRKETESECRFLRDQLKKEELKQRQLEKDLRTTRQVLNEAYREKHDVEKKSGMAIETLKFQIMSLSGDLQRKKMLTERVRKEKELLMEYYQDKISTMIQHMPTEGTALMPPFTSLPMLEDKSIQTGHCSSSHNSLRNKIIDLEFRLYRHEKLVEALCDIIQSHDPNFVLEEDEILQTFLNPKEENPYTGTQTDNCLGLPDDLCLFADPEFADMESMSSQSSDTCATYESIESETFSYMSNDTDIIESYISDESPKSVSMTSSLDSDSL